jgi:hypothetical protein
VRFDVLKGGGRRQLRDDGGQRRREDGAVRTAVVWSDNRRALGGYFLASHLQNIRSLPVSSLAPTVVSMASKKSASKKLKKVEPLSRPPDEKPKPKEKFRTRRTTGAKPEVKTKRTSLKPARNKKQKKEYTEKELGIPQLNGIIPAGVRKPPGKKRGKIFVDDAESMLAILGMVQAEKEGEREGKLMKAVRLAFLSLGSHADVNSANSRRFARPS